MAVSVALLREEELEGVAVAPAICLERRNTHQVEVQAVQKSSPDPYSAASKVTRILVSTALARGTRIARTAAETVANFILSE